MKFSVLLQYLTPHRRVLLSVLCLLLIGSLVSLVNPWIAGQLTSLVMGGESYFPSLEFMLLAWLGLIALKSILTFATQYMIGSTGEIMTASLRTRLYDHLLALPMTYFHGQRPGDVLTLLSKDAEAISRFVTSTLVQLLPLLLTFSGAFVMMALIDPSIALLAVFLLPVYYVAMKLIGRRIRPLTREWIDSYSDMVSFIEENLGLLPAIKTFIREPLEAERFDKKNTRLLVISKRQLFIQSILSPAIGFLAGVGLLLLLWLASVQLENGLLSPADLVSLLLYAMLLTQPIGSLANVYGQVQHTKGAAERILTFFSVQAEPVGEGKPEMPSVSGRIRFENIYFSYPERNDVLCGLNLDIQAGETIAIVGENGAGKSTLVHLLMRLFDPNNGRIIIDDTDVRDASLASLRAQIGLVAQHTLLLNGTVRENIAYGCFLASQQEIEQSARVAHAHDFITQLPKGYDTLIGDQGLRLSGGQRQRIALARTLLKDPPILVLDEATSMFDPGGEKSFIEECRHLLTMKTVILITHRSASLALADRIFKLENGVLRHILEVSDCSVSIQR